MNPKRPPRLLTAALIAISTVGWAAACSSNGDTDVGTDSGTGSTSGSGSGSGADSGSGGANSSGGGLNLGDAGSGGTVMGMAGAFSVTEAGEFYCGDVLCECNDGIDNDNDGTADGFDVECTGPYDNDESSFATGISGDNKDPKWQDCFFDGNSGAGDDGCKYHTECALPDGNPPAGGCDVTQECLDFCAARTPNGCDCFGCCDIQTDQGVISVVISDSCDFENINDTDACPRCTRSDQCGNECGECELCPGKTELPASCNTGTGGSSGTGGSGSGGSGTGGSGTGGSPGYTCDNGETVCATSTDCGSGEYCQLGCCLPVVIR